MKYLWIIFVYSIIFFAETSNAASGKASVSQNLENIRLNNENKIPPYFGISFYQPNYILPYYYTVSPDNAIYAGETPDNESLKHNEFKYQFSLKVPLWKNINNWPVSLYLAYTQLSYFQVYARKSFFRETDYQPEIFLANNLDYNMGKSWIFNFINVGASHESNGVGTSLERGWDRFYVEAIASSHHWRISLQPWYIISTNQNNSNIGKYLGYGRAIVAAKFYKNVISLEARNIIEHQARYATAQLTWSFPITKYFKGYTQVFSGYGQSLVEYNHRTNSAGIGVALSDWE